MKVRLDFVDEYYAVRCFKVGPMIEKRTAHIRYHGEHRPVPFAELRNRGELTLGKNTDSGAQIVHEIVVISDRQYRSDGSGHLIELAPSQRREPVRRVWQWVFGIEKTANSLRGPRAAPAAAGRKISMGTVA